MQPIQSKQVRLPNGTMEPAGEKLTMHNGLRSPANAAISLPSLKTTLISNSKLADAGYVTVYDNEEVNVYDGATTTVVPTKQAVMTGWRDKLTGLWRFPLHSQVTNATTETKLLSEAKTNAIVDEVTSNVHDLPSTERVIRMLHAAAGFPAKATWIEAIKKGFYASWPMINARTANKYFPESEETQKGHMKQKCSGVRKTNRRIEFVMQGDDKDLETIDSAITDLKRKRQDIML
ncbi:hypothetical protein ACHAXN_001427 [Cyclotella atomus]